MPDDHERRGECRDDFKRQDREINDIKKPGGSIATVHKKVEDIKVCLQKELNMKVGLRIFMWIVGGVAVLAFVGFSANLTYTYAIDRASASHVTEDKVDKKVDDIKEYVKEEVEDLETTINRLRIESAKDKQEILDAIKHNNK